MMNPKVNRLAKAVVREVRYHGAVYFSVQIFVDGFQVFDCGSQLSRMGVLGAGLDWATRHGRALEWDWQAPATSVALAV